MFLLRISLNYPQYPLLSGALHQERYHKILKMGASRSASAMPIFAMSEQPKVYELFNKSSQYKVGTYPPIGVPMLEESSTNKSKNVFIFRNSFMEYIQNM